MTRACDPVLTLAGQRLRAGPAGTRRSARAAEVAERSRARRFHRLLGVGRHRRLALADGHARSRATSRAFRSTPEGRRVGLTVGSRERRGGGRSVQGVRRAGDHARARTPAHHVAGRQHAEDRNGFRHADAAASLRRQAARARASRRAAQPVAGLFGRAVGAAGARDGHAAAGPGRHATGHAGTIARSRDDASCGRDTCARTACRTARTPS